LNHHSNFYNVLNKSNKYYGAGKTYADQIPLNTTELKKSILSFNVFYKKMSHAKSEETSVMSFDDLISLIGGNMGLFLGISMLTVIEFIEVIYNIIHKIIKN
jgi:hypothetical protein